MRLLITLPSADRGGVEEYALTIASAAVQADWEVHGAFPRTKETTSLVKDQVLFLGYRRDVPRLLKSADLFVFPTHYEGLPFALLEAMAYNLPVVASDADTIIELVEHQLHCLIFRKSDRHDLLETLLWALSHPSQMQKLAENGQQRVQDFSETKMIEETLEVLQRQINSN